MRTCEHCQASIEHKRKDARFCDRACKMAYWHVANRATPEGKAVEVERNTARYSGEAETRRSSAKAYYYANQEASVEYSRTWRQENPLRRQAQSEKRADLIRSNPGFVSFNDAEWQQLLRRFDYRCAYCGSCSGSLERDHVIPLSRGGRHAIANVLPACGSCNRAKQSKFLSEWRLHQKKQAALVA